MIRIMIQSNNITVVNRSVAGPFFVFHRAGQDSSGQYDNGFRLDHDILRFVIFRRRRKSFDGSYADQFNTQALGLV